jgi:hypothetical protein
MPGAPHYAEAFSPLPGRCFRMVAHHGEAGPMHCPEPVVWRGSWRAPNGRRYRLEPAKVTDLQPSSVGRGRIGIDRGMGTRGH